MKLTELKHKLNNNIDSVLDNLNIKYEILGDNIYSTCPIHEESDNSRAFSFCKKRNIWKCWTRGCEKDYKNDIFGLIQAILSKEGEEVNFSKVIKWINTKLHIKTGLIQQENNISSDEFQDIVTALSKKQTIDSNKPIEISFNYNIPSQYFISRGFSKKTLEYFGVGDCEEKTSKMYNRAIIPIHDHYGKNIIGLIGRSVKEHKIPKFLIYPKGMVKNSTLYNAHNAIEHIKKSNSIILVEGQGDVWRLYESGVFNVVGMFGKCLSQQQIDYINKLPITKVVVMTDNDQAGRDAKLQIKRSLSRLYTLIFPHLPKKDVGEMSVEDIKTQVLTQIEGCY